MNMRNARTTFAIRTKLTICKYNNKNYKDYASQLWECDSCEKNIETQSHIISSEAYADLRKDKNLNNDDDLVEYFNKVMEIREKFHLTR